MRAGPFIGLTAVVSFLLGLVAAGTRPPFAGAGLDDLRPASSTPLRLERVSTPSAVPPSTGGVDFAAVSARVNPAVVNVDAASRGDLRPRSRRYSTDDPTAPREGSGSGFIIDADGFILTNHHVIDGADRVTVTLTDGRIFRAEVVGFDRVIDVALLQIHSRDPLPVAPIGDSDRLRVGEWVCAIGNPLGVYVHSVTVGVVSFIGRKIFDPTLDAFIQTDAAISFGSSGGPLINAQGEVVGITTAVSAQAPNIGFAIPIAQVVSILPQLRDRGTVARGYIGVGLTTLTPALRRALKLEPSEGALVQDVTPDTPAERAGLRAYDVVVGIDGQAVSDDEELIRHISGRQPGTVAALDIWREGGVRRVSVKLSVRPEPNSRQPARLPDVQTVSAQAPLGLSVRELTDEDARRLKLPDWVEGVLVTDVDPAGPARVAQLRVNHVILEINRRPVRSDGEYRSAVNRLTDGEAAALLVYEKSTGQRAIFTVVSDATP